MPEVKHSPDQPRHGSTDPYAVRDAMRKETRDGMFAAVLMAVFLHLLLFWASPREWFPKAPEREIPPHSMEILLEPLPEEAEQEERYVRATPNVPERPPEETMNISDRDQQAAQEEEVAALDPENTPMVDGDEPESNRLVQGNPFQEPTPPSPPEASQTQGQSQMVQQEAAPREAAAPSNPEFLPQEPETDEGLASIIDPATSPERSEEAEEPELSETVSEITSRMDGEGQDQVTTPPQTAAEQTPSPRPRQRVERDTSFGPIKENRQGAIRVGRLAFDSRYSEFGDYWRRVAEIIEVRWRNLVYNTRSIPLGGNRVVVSFDITREGQVRNVEVQFSNAGKLAETVSVDAIVGEAPFFEWTPEMIVKMGESAECAIHFHY